jgi:hypothetical protein
MEIACGTVTLPFVADFGDFDVRRRSGVIVALVGPVDKGIGRA